MLDRFADQLGHIFVRQRKGLAQSILRTALLDGIQQGIIHDWVLCFSGLAGCLAWDFRGSLLG